MDEDSRRVSLKCTHAMATPTTNPVWQEAVTMTINEEDVDSECEQYSSGLKTQYMYWE